ncbi:granzyme A-like [Mantella aurantiaca]
MMEEQGHSAPTGPDFFNSLNYKSFNSSFKYTFNKKKITFLDLEISIKQNGYLSFTLYHKPLAEACVKIVGGKEAKPHSRPYMVYIKEKIVYCGGTLINPFWVLTAAHCDVKRTASIILGAHSISANETTKQVRKISRVIAHERYKKGLLDNDVALLKLSEKATLTYAVKPLPLPGRCNEPVKGTVCSVAGWGRINNKETYADKLKEANVTIMDRKSCNKYWRGKITENMICTSEKRKIETCEGDSGGPLVCKGALQGIVSFGEDKCGIPGNAAVYANLNCKIICWIYKQMASSP